MELFIVSSGNIYSVYSFWKPTWCKKFRNWRLLRQPHSSPGQTSWWDCWQFDWHISHCRDHSAAETRNSYLAPIANSKKILLHSYVGSRSLKSPHPIKKKSGFLYFSPLHPSPKSGREFLIRVLRLTPGEERPTLSPAAHFSQARVTISCISFDWQYGK